MLGSFLFAKFGVYIRFTVCLLVLTLYQKNELRKNLFNEIIVNLFNVNGH